MAVREDHRRKPVLARVCVAFIGLYQKTIAHWLGGHCRFEPSCSEYARQAIEWHGVIRGLRLAAQRLWRCRPGFPAGDDPVPPRRVYPLKRRGTVSANNGARAERPDPAQPDYGMVLPH